MENVASLSITIWITVISSDKQSFGIKTQDSWQFHERFVLPLSLLLRLLLFLHTYIQHTYENCRTSFIYVQDIEGVKGTIKKTAQGCKGSRSPWMLWMQIQNQQFCYEQEMHVHGRSEFRVHPAETRENLVENHRKGLKTIPGVNFCCPKTAALQRRTWE